MAIEEVPVQYKTSDGREFDTKEAAERHYELITARENYDSARDALGRLLAATQKTADGHPFNLMRWGDFYHIVDTYWEMPQMREVKFYGVDFIFDRDDQFVIRHREGDRNVEYRMSELYSDKRAAEHALLAAQEKWLMRQQEKIEGERKRLLG